MPYPLEIVLSFESWHINWTFPHPNCIDLAPHIPLPCPRESTDIIQTNTISSPTVSPIPNPSPSASPVLGLVLALVLAPSPSSSSWSVHNKDFLCLPSQTACLSLCCSCRKKVRPPAQLHKQKSH